MLEVKLCHFIYIFLCVDLITICKCSRNNPIKLLYYIQLNKELNYKYLVLFINNINKTKSNKYYKPSRVFLNYLNYKEQTSLQSLCLSFQRTLSKL